MLPFRVSPSQGKELFDQLRCELGLSQNLADHFLIFLRRSLLFERTPEGGKILRLPRLAEAVDVQCVTIHCWMQLGRLPDRFGSRPLDCLAAE